MSRYFAQFAASSEEQVKVDGAKIEAAYHALALGDSKPAIYIGIGAFLWRDTAARLWTPS